ncbi:TonB-dependent receptor [Simiduia litorea]|uniref:TonB-dependent receptor n=1 Tax=Simiduia litorea TaxID=1435348 RepID=UPI0036F2E88C
MNYAKTPLALAVSILIAGYGPVVGAQDTQNDSRTPTLEEVVVTGIAGGGEIRKLDASFAITNVTDEDIKRFSPKSTADLLKTIPGVWAESSGGIAGANVFVRGFPSSGDAPFLTVQLEGAPIFPPPTVSFLENTTLFRIDETIERMEGLRGGTQSVLDNGQPGLTTNFLLKRGGEETEGLVKYSTSDYNLQRVDGVMSGKLSDGLYYMVGGYTSTSPGIRDAGFNAEEGKQFTVNITKDLDQGSVNFYHRNTDDAGVWYLPVALNVPGVDASFNQLGTLNRQSTITYGPDNSVEAVDLGEGRGWKGSVSGMNFDFTVNENLTLSNSLNVTAGEANTFGLVPNGNAVNVGDLLDDPAADTGAVVIGALTGAVTGNAIGRDAYIQQQGAWVVRKDIESFTNNLALSGNYEAYEFSLGYYTATTSIDEWWSLGNQKYMVVANGGERVDGIECNQASVDSCGWNYDIDATGDARSNALYGSFTWHASDALSVDIGLRSENHQVEYTVDEGLDNVITKSVQYDETKSSLTLGANYDLNENQGLFARYSQGYKFPYFDDFRDNFGAYSNGEDLIKEVTQFELGYKAAFDTLSAYVTLFGNEVKGDTFVTQPGAPAQVFTNQAYGVELDGRWYHESGFALTLNGTVQNTEVTENPALTGKEAQRQPNYQVRLSPSYDLALAGDMAMTFYGAVSFIGDRFADPDNEVTLEAYEKIDLGVLVDVSENLQLQLALDNVTDEQALTEGDPRDPAAANGRYIMPFSTVFSVAYQF